MESDSAGPLAGACAAVLAPAAVVNVRLTGEPLLGTYIEMLFGTPPPIATVTVMVCGASRAFGSETVTTPVYDPF